MAERKETLNIVPKVLGSVIVHYKYFLFLKYECQGLVTDKYNWRKKILTLTLTLLCLMSASLF